MCHDHFGYICYLPLGTIGKLLNHLSHRIEFIEKCTQVKDTSELKSILIDNLPASLTRNISSDGLNDYLQHVLSSTVSPDIRENIVHLSELIKKKIFLAPQDIMDRQRLLDSISSNNMFNSIREDMLSARLKRPRASEQPVDHHKFEAIMDASNIAHVIEVNERLSSSPQEKFLLIGSQPKRVFFGNQMSTYSRHFLSLFYWITALRPAMKDDVTAKKLAQRALSFRLRNMESIKIDIDALIKDNEHIIYPDLVKFILTEFWTPYISSLSENGSLDFESNELISENVKKSLKGDEGATKFILDAAHDDARDALRVLIDTVGEDTLDPLMYAFPSLEDNERFKRIMKEK